MLFLIIVLLLFFFFPLLSSSFLFFALRRRETKNPGFRCHFFGKQKTNFPAGGCLSGPSPLAPTGSSRQGKIFWFSLCLLVGFRVWRERERERGREERRGGTQETINKKKGKGKKSFYGSRWFYIYRSKSCGTPLFFSLI